MDNTPVRLRPAPPIKSTTSHPKGELKHRVLSWLSMGLNWNRLTLETLATTRGAFLVKTAKSINANDAFYGQELKLAA